MLVGTLLQCGVSVTAPNLTESWLSLRCSLVCKRSSNGRDPTAPSRYATRSAPWRLSPAFIYCLVGGCSSSGVTSHLRHGCHYSSRQKIRLKLWGIWTQFFLLNPLCVRCLLCTDIVLCRWRKCGELETNYFALGKFIKSSSKVYSHGFHNPWRVYVFTVFHTDRKCTYSSLSK